MFCLLYIKLYLWFLLFFTIYFVYIYIMRFILNHRVFENIQQSDKILKDRGIQKDEHIIKLENSLKINGLSSYMSYIIDLFFKLYQWDRLIDDDNIDKIVDGLKFIKSDHIDVSKLNCEDIYDFFTKVCELKEDGVRNRFISKYAPASLRSDVKRLVDNRSYGSFLFSDRYLTQIKNLTKQNMELLKNGSRFKTSREWLMYVEKILQDDKFSIEELKGSNITILFENNEWLIYKPLDFKSYLIPNYKYWCTMVEVMFKAYSRWDLIIYLNKSNKENSYVSYNNAGGVQVYNYKNGLVKKEDYNDIINKGIKFHTTFIPI